ncbi:uncharacterized protein JCM15063_005035 [Sporobolomyces koalae]|uniref:uncharacterized protein n=1 Tax=Sporobolomyces koalae TaxID=500713 RepID=UPI0031760155
MASAAPIPGLPTPLTVSTGLPTPAASASSTPGADAQQLWPSPLTVSSKPLEIPAPAPTGAPLSVTTTVLSVDTELVTVTSTETAAPVTITQTVLLTSTISSTSASSAPSPSAVQPSPTSSISSSPSIPLSSGVSSWEVSSNFAGNITKALGARKWSWGANNAKLVDSVPTTAWATAAPATSTTAPSQVSPNEAAVFPIVDLSNGPAMQVTFPKGSINPANKDAPTGGVGMYLSPLDLSKATNVSLEYSVFFPADFDFVKGGKLPGLYGGHTGCSGGQESEDCFSTRLMFRTGGKGELYLYVPKGVQSEALCKTPPLSYCDSTYGLSIGRGAWTFERGAWSNIRQEIRLNTPGVADGGFRIFVNNKLVMSSNAVLFRSDLAPAPTSSSPFAALPTAPSSPSETSSAIPSTSSIPDNEDQGLLGGLLGGLAGELGGIVKRSPFNTITETLTPSTTVFATATMTVNATPLSSATTQAGLVDQITDALPAAGDLPLVGDGSILAPKKVNRPTDNAAFQGIMFNTFFGGNDPSWASPKEQTIWFNRIGLTINA